MRPARESWFEGWRLLAMLTLVLIVLCLWIAGMRQFEVDGVRMVIRFTARTSLLLFCLAFSAAALARLRPDHSRDRPTRLAPAAPERQLLPLDSVHGVVRQADSRHAVLQPLSASSAYRTGTAADCDGVDTQRAAAPGRMTLHPY